MCLVLLHFVQHIEALLTCVRPDGRYRTVSYDQIDHRLPVCNLSSIIHMKSGGMYALVQATVSFCLTCGHLGAGAVRYLLNVEVPYVELLRSVQSPNCAFMLDLIACSQLTECLPADAWSYGPLAWL